MFKLWTCSSCYRSASCCWMHTSMVSRKAQTFKHGDCNSNHNPCTYPSAPSCCWMLTSMCADMLLTVWSLQLNLSSLLCFNQCLVLEHQPCTFSSAPPCCWMRICPLNEMLLHPCNMKHCTHVTGNMGQAWCCHALQYTATYFLCSPCSCGVPQHHCGINVVRHQYHCTPI